MQLEPIDLRDIDKNASNVYEAITAAAKKARTINDEQKLEFNALVSTIPATSDDDDIEVFDNPAQLKISLDFEKRKKPHHQALDQLLNGDIEFEYKQ